nr:uncharacterized protein LOC125184253 [Anser cygnoides]
MVMKISPSLYACEETRGSPAVVQAAAPSRGALGLTWVLETSLGLCSIAIAVVRAAGRRGDRFPVRGLCEHALPSQSRAWHRPERHSPSVGEGRLLSRLVSWPVTQHPRPPGSPTASLCCSRQAKRTWKLLAVNLNPKTIEISVTDRRTWGGSRVRAAGSCRASAAFPACAGAAGGMRWMKSACSKQLGAFIPGKVFVVPVFSVWRASSRASRDGGWQWRCRAAAWAPSAATLQSSPCLWQPVPARPSPRHVATERVRGWGSKLPNSKGMGNTGERA